MQQTTLQGVRVPLFQQHKRLFSASREKAVSGKNKASDTASCALPASVRVRCASDAGKRGSDAVSELHRLIQVSFLWLWHSGYIHILTWFDLELFQVQLKLLGLSCVLLVRGIVNIWFLSLGVTYDPGSCFWNTVPFKHCLVSYWCEVSLTFDFCLLV